MTRARKPEARGRGRPIDDGGDRRARILDAAVTRFARYGIAATPVAAIARDAAVTPALEHYYFGDREQLLDALMRSARAGHARRRAGARRTGDDALEAMRRIARGVVAAATEHPWLAPLWVREVLSEGGLLRERLLVLAREAVTKRLRDHIAAAQRAGRIRGDLDPRLVVVSVMGLTLFALAAAPIWRQLLDADDIPIAALAAHAIALLERGLEPA